MNKDKQIKEIACKKCLHYEGCLKRFRGAKKNGQYELIDETEYFAHADECDFFITGYHKQSEGEWVVVMKYNDYRMFNEAKIACSVCGHKPKYEGYLSDMNYCPNCGAKMEGGERE